MFCAHLNVEVTGYELCCVACESAQLSIFRSQQHTQTDKVQKHNIVSCKIYGCEEIILYKIFLNGQF